MEFTKTYVHVLDLKQNNTAAFVRNMNLEINEFQNKLKEKSIPFSTVTQSTAADRFLHIVTIITYTNDYVI
jgi:hypothetical protein